MPPAGFYTDFLHRFVPFGVAKEMAHQCLHAAKQWAADLSLLLCSQWTRQKLTTELHSTMQALPMALLVMEMLFGKKQAWAVAAEGLVGGTYVKLKVHERNVSWLKVAPYPVLRSVVRGFLDPLWRQYAADASPGRREQPDGSLVACTERGTPARY